MSARAPRTAELADHPPTARIYSDRSGRLKQPLSLLLLYRVQTRRSLFHWLSLNFLQFLVPAGFVGMLQMSRCRRLPEKIGVPSRAPKKWVDSRAQGPLPSEFFISA